MFLFVIVHIPMFKNVALLVNKWLVVSTSIRVIIVLVRGK
jgi:hypothetical protein